MLSDHEEKFKEAIEAPAYLKQNLQNCISGTTLKLRKFPFKVTDRDLLEISKNIPLEVNYIDTRGCTYITAHGIARMLPNLPSACSIIWTDYTTVPVLSDPTILLGHTNWVPVITPLSNGFFASGSDDGTICIWDDSGKKIAQLIDHKGCIYSLTEIPGGLLASGSEDKTIRLWNINNDFTCVSILKGHEDSVWGVGAINEKILVSCSWDKTIRLWSFSTGESIKIINSSNQKSFLSLAMSPLGKSFACSTFDGTTYVYNDKGDCLQTLQGDGENIWTLEYLHNGHLAGGSDSNAIYVWNPETGERVREIKSPHNGRVRMLTTLPNGILASGSDDRTIRLWDIDTWQCLRSFEGGVAPIWAFGILSSGQLAIGYQSIEDNVKLFKFLDRQEPTSFLAYLRSQCECLIDDRTIRVRLLPSVVSVRREFLERYVRFVLEWASKDKNLLFYLDKDGVTFKGIGNRQTFLLLLELSIISLGIEKKHILHVSCPDFLSIADLKNKIDMFLLFSHRPEPKRIISEESENIKIQSLIASINRKIDNHNRMNLERNPEHFTVLIELYSTVLGLSRLLSSDPESASSIEAYEKAIVDLIKELFYDSFYERKNIAIANLNKLFRAFTTGLENIRLQSRPDAINSRKDLINHFRKTEDDLKNLLTEVFSTVQRMLKIPENNLVYAVLCIGSLATHTVTPYSDLEYIILVNHYSDKVQTYFQKFSYLVRLIIVGFGESPLEKSRILFSQSEIDSLEKYFKKGTRVDTHKNPTDINYLFSLVNTPESFLENIPLYVLNEPTNHLTSALLTTSVIAANNDQSLSLFEKYKEMLEKKLIPVGSYALMLLQLIDQKVSELWTDIQHLDNSRIRLKQNENIEIKKLLIHFIHLPRLLLMLIKCFDKNEISLEEDDDCFTVLDKLADMGYITSRERQTWEDCIVKLFILRLITQKKNNSASSVVKLHSLDKSDISIKNIIGCLMSLQNFIKGYSFKCQTKLSCLASSTQDHKLDSNDRVPHNRKRKLVSHFMPADDKNIKENQTSSCTTNKSENLKTSQKLSKPLSKNSFSEQHPLRRSLFSAQLITAGEKPMKESLYQKIKAKM